jgi:hypothetical protein
VARERRGGEGRRWGARRRGGTAADAAEAAEWDRPGWQTMEGGAQNDSMTARQRRKKRGKDGYLWQSEYVAPETRGVPVRGVNSR